MIVTRLALEDFRNYASADLALVPGPNLFVGPNGQGKTNLLESIGYVSTLGSHRVSGDRALIRQGAESAIVRLRLEHDGRGMLVELQLNRSAPNRAQVNRGPVKVRELPRYLSSVLFAPEDLSLVRGDPGGRRRFLDELLVQRTPRLAGVLADYDRVLRQRTTLLKSARSAGVRDDRLTTLDIWDERLVALGSEIIEARAALVDALRGPIVSAYTAIAGEEHAVALALALSIAGGDPEEGEDAEAIERDPGRDEGSDVSSRFRAALARKRRAELERGLCLVGPHRDDLVLMLNGMPARGYASHGESWSFALALRLASAEILRDGSPGGDPVLMLDDVFAELDVTRRVRLAQAVVAYEQVLVTAAVLEDVPVELRAHVVHIRAGRVVDDEGSAA